MTLVDELMPEIADYAEYGKGLSVCVVGFGKMGMLHSGILNLLAPGSVRSIVDRSRLLVFGASRLMKKIGFHREIDEMLESEDPDVVYVTTPSPSHYGVISRLLEASVRYIFVEKPPTTNSMELASLIDKMSDNQFVMVGFQKRFALPFRHARMLLSKDVIGDVEEVSAYIKSGDIVAPTERFDHQSRGVLLDLGIHLIDLLVWLFDASVVEVAKCRSIHTGVDDYFEADLRTGGNAKVRAEATWSSPDYRLPETYIEAHGTDGVLRATEDYLRVESLDGRASPDEGTSLEMYKPDYYRGVPPVNLADPEYTLEDVHFLYSIHSGMEPMTSLRNVAQTMELIDELYGEAGL